MLTLSTTVDLVELYSNFNSVKGKSRLIFNYVVEVEEEHIVVHVDLLLLLN